MNNNRQTIKRLFRCWNRPESILVYLVALILAWSLSGCEKDDKPNNEEKPLAKTSIDFTSFTIVEDELPYETGNITFQLVETTPEDCDGGGSRYFGSTGEGLWLDPCRLVVNLEKLSGISRITITGLDRCNRDCTKAFVYDGNGNTLQSTSNSSSYEGFTFVFASNLDDAVLLGVSSCEGVIKTIVIE